MAEGKGTRSAKRPAKPTPASKAPPVAQAVPPAQRSDFLVSGSSNADLNCRTALLFPKSAPLADLAVVGPDHRAKLVRQRKDKTESTTLDLQAVWAQVVKPPVKNETAVLVFLHGFYTFVTIDVAGQCATPSWGDTDLSTETMRSATAASKADKLKAARCAVEGYAIDAALKAYKGPLIALAPENARPYIAAKVVNNVTTFPFGIPAKHIANDAGNLGQPDSLGSLIEECLRRLTAVKTLPGRPGCPAPLATVPTVTRLFLAGHSGASRGLYGCAKSAIAKKIPTDMILLDCFYNNGNDALKEFADNAKGGLGNAAGQSRIILVHDPGSYRPGGDAFSSMRSDLKTRHKAKVTDVQFKAGKNSKETALNALGPTKQALQQFPVVIVSGSLGHFTIPGDFVPLVLETAP